VTAAFSLLLDRTIFLALLFLIALFAIPYGSVQPWWEALFECFVFGLVALWAVQCFLTGTWRISGARSILPLVALIALLFVQTLPWQGGRIANEIQLGWQAISADPYETRRAAIKLTAYTTTLALMLRYVSSLRRLRLLVLAVIGVGTGSALFGIVRQMMQQEAGGFILAHLQPNQGYGQFINANHFAFLLEMVLPLSLILILSGVYRREQLFVWFAIALTISSGIVLANSRGGILVLICETVFLLAMLGLIRSEGGLEKGERWFRLREFCNLLPVRVTLITCLSLILIAGVFLVGGEPLTRRLDERTVANELTIDRAGLVPGVRRVDMWMATIELIKARPVLGTGFGGYSAAITRYFDYSGRKTLLQAHNDYLELAAGGGIIGVALGAWFVMGVLSNTRRNLSSRDRFRRAACLGSLAGFVAVAIHSLYDFPLHTTSNALILVALIAIATANIRVEEQKARNVCLASG
jgi:O-antigen ligase